MSEKKKHKNYTIADIERYHKGLLSRIEMHELEKAALDDPFLADAVEGYAAVPVNTSTDLPELKKRLEERINNGKVIPISAGKNSFGWWKVAAAVVMIGIIAFITIRLSTGRRNGEVAVRTGNKDRRTTEVIPSNDSRKPGSTEAITSDSDNKAVEMIAVTPGKKYSRKTTLPATAPGDKASQSTAEVAAPIFKLEEFDSSGVQANTLAKEDNDQQVLAGVKPSTRDKNRLSEAVISPEKRSLQKIPTQPNYFRGKVVDAKNNPLPFANITMTRYSIGTYADAQGNFTLISADSVLEVQVHSIGFENNLTQLKNNVASNKIILKDDDAAIDRVVGYQKQKHDTTRLRSGSMNFDEPEPADGWSNYDTYLANNLNMPGGLQNEAGKGRVELSFDVNQHGEPVNIRVERSLCQKCDDEAIRLVKEGPKWKKKNAKTKRAIVIIPFDSNN